MYFQEHLRKPSSSDVIGTHLAHQSGLAVKDFRASLQSQNIILNPQDVTMILPSETLQEIITDVDLIA